MIKISEALKIIERQTHFLQAETVKIENAVGRILAEEIFADMDLPPFDRSQMDGFAVITQDTENAPVKLEIIGESVAGKGFEGQLKSGQTVRIMTGAPVPKGADAVQKVELTDEKEGLTEILERAVPGQNINKKASEISRGARIFVGGEKITAQMIAAIASFGYAELKVFRRPKLAVLSTGSEIVGINETPQKDQIRNSNSVMLKAFAERFADAEILPHVGDEAVKLHSAIADATDNFDILITTGGVSVGDYDFTKPVLNDLGAEIFFEKVSLKPGKPIVFARRRDCLIFGLPGNPVSSAVTFLMFVRAAILRMQSAENCSLKKGFAVALNKIKAAKERDSVLPVSISNGADGKMLIETVRFSGSSNFIAFARADALVFVPQNQHLESGDVAEIYFLD